MNKKITFVSFCTVLVLVAGCKKNTTTPATPKITAETVLSTEASGVIIPMYITLAKDAGYLYNGTVVFQTTPNQTNLLNCRQLWLTATADYEQSAATLFGPGGSLGADPASVISTYPIDTAGINVLINSSAVFTLNYIDSLPPYLTGFHGMEFELYGINGNKMATQFTSQQLSYITAVAQSIAAQTGAVDTNWMTSYLYQFVNAGNGSSVYPDQRAAFSDLTMAIANICETDAIYKLEGILNNKSTILQESPFANNSIANIQNNLAGVSAIYYGQFNSYYGQSGNTAAGLSAFVKQYAENLDIKIKYDLTAAQKAVGAITVPLSQAIYSQSSQMDAAITACDSLDDDLKVDLLTVLNSNTN